MNKKIFLILLCCLLIFPATLAVKLDSTFITLNEEGAYNFDFTASGDFLVKYKIIQNSVVLLENLDGETKIEKSINLPFKTNSINISIYDMSGDSLQEEISLISPLNTSYGSRFIDTPIINFTSNAQNCHLIKVNRKDIGRDFQKNGEKFSYEFETETNTNLYEILFYCENHEYREYQSFNIQLNNIEPTNQDKNTSRETNETKNNKTQTDLPENKEKILFKINLKRNQDLENSTYPLKIYTEENISVELGIENDGEVLFSNSWDEILSQPLKIVIEFEKGINEVILSLKDKKGNKQIEKYNITYLIGQIEDEITAGNLTANQTSKINATNQTAIKKSSNNDGKTDWALILLLFIIILFILILFLFLSPISRTKQTEKVDFSREKDIALKQSLQKIKEKRIERQQNIIKEKNQSKIKKREHTDYEKRKIEDLGRRNTDLDLNYNRKTEISQKKPKKEEEPKQKRNYKKEMTTDKINIGNYLQKIKNTPSWSSPKEYRQKKEPIPQQEKPAPPKKNEETKTEKQAIEEQNPPKPEKPKFNIDDYLRKKTKKRKDLYFTEKEMGL